MTLGVGTSERSVRRDLISLNCRFEIGEFQIGPQAVTFFADPPGRPERSADEDIGATGQVPEGGASLLDAMRANEDDARVCRQRNGDPALFDDVFTFYVTRCRGGAPPGAHGTH